MHGHSVTHSHTCKSVRISTLSAALLVLSGCAALALPERPTYNGQDIVDAVSTEQIVGSWDITPLNPLPDAGLHASVIRYRADGTVTAVVHPPEDTSPEDTSPEDISPEYNLPESSQQSDPATDSRLFDEARFLVSGRWSVVDGKVVHRDVSMLTRSDNENARLLSAMINESSATATSVAEVHEIGDDYMILVGRDGVAMHYARRPVTDK